MKKSIALIPFLFLLMATSINSQNRQQRNRTQATPVKERVETVLEKITTDLELSEKQVDSADEILTDFFSSVDDLRRNRNRDMRSQLESLTMKRDEGLEAFMTDAQKKKFKEIKEDLFPTRRRPND